jgi:hypothetical protein
MTRARIDWTPTEADEDWTSGEEDSCADGSDMEFYGTPWFDADEGDVLACWNEGEAHVTVGRKEADSISFWEVPIEKALDRLKAARIAFLEEEISRFSKERAELIPDDGTSSSDAPGAEATR